ncbi:hypothetical protein [Flavobacterium sp.]|jgi:hypothetical protein|uniref:hypothetical protein n=1 Tax=Flavobacterium sp. TaxID=239 RepID=UPI0037BEE443
MKTTQFILGLALVFTFYSCNIDDKEEKGTITSEEMQVNAKIDIASDDVSNIVEEQLTLDDGIVGRGTTSATQFLPACAVVTRVPETGVPAVGQNIVKTINFGTSGCEMPNGNVLKGVIIITIPYLPNATTHTITYQFVNFYHNAIKFDGTRTFSRTMSAAVDGHPIVTMNMDFNATFPNGNVYTRVGTRVREIIEGMNTPFILADNIYKITGSWTTTFPNTTVQTSTITTPLNVKMSCISVNKPLLVSGVITITRNNNVATLDYGDGTCDNLAIFTLNGVAYSITFGY